VGFVENLISS